MLAVIGGIVFIITAVVGWVDPSVSVPHLIALLAVAGAFVAFHLAFRVWRPGDHW